MALAVHPVNLLVHSGSILGRMSKQTPIQRWGKIWIWHREDYSISVCEDKDILLYSSNCAVSLGFRAEKYCLAFFLS